LQLRIGLNLGDVIVEENGDVYGEGVNVAARLEALADPGGILISAKVHSEIEGKVEAAFEDRGEQQVKNIARPVRAYAARAAAAKSTIVGPLTAGSTDKPLPLPDKPSIAVLPFQNMSGDPEQEYFADGMVEDIITALSRKKGLFVIARNSSFTYKNQAVDIRRVGRELGVRYVLEGSVRKAGGRVRITGQLIEAQSGSHLWADRFEGALEDVFDLQDRVTSNVVGAIFPELERAEIARARSKPTESLEAYDYYLRAVACNYDFTKEANLKSLKCAREATEIDPTFALCHAIGAVSFVQRRAFGWSVDLLQEQEEATLLANRAIDLDKTDPLVLAMVGQVYSFVLRRTRDGLALLERAIALDPNLASARYWYGGALAFSGDRRSAREQYSMALRLSPLDSRIFLAQNGLAFGYFFDGEYEEAASWARQASRQQPNYPPAYRILAASLAMMGNLGEARSACTDAMRLTPTWSISADSLTFFARLLISSTT